MLLALILVAAFVAICVVAVAVLIVFGADTTDMPGGW